MRIRIRMSSTTCTPRLQVLDRSAWAPGRRFNVLLTLLLGAAGTLLGCNDEVPTKEPEPPPIYSETPLPPLESTCPDQRGMVGVPFPDGTCYLMDPWPVTRGEYYGEVNKAPLASSHPECGDQMPASAPRERVSYTFGNPGAYCYITEDSDEDTGASVRVDNRMPWPPAGDELAEPMVCVTWCDAHAYCERVGKRLCSNRGLGDTDEYNEAALHDPATDEYFNACSGGGARPSPNGLPYPLIERPRRYIAGELGYYEDLPLSRNELVAGGGGAYQGIWGLGVIGEMTGPAFLTTRPRGNIELDGQQDPLAACGAGRAERRSRWLEIDRHGDFWGSLGFRCCADSE